MATTITYGSVVLGATDGFGCRWKLITLEGWGGSPASTIDLQQKPRQSGGWAGDAFFTPRYIHAAGTITAPTPEALNLAIDRLNDSVALFDRQFLVDEAGKSRWVNARRNAEVQAIKVNNRMATYDVQVVALDGRKRGATLSWSTALPASVGGLTIPFTVPFSIGATQVSGQVSLTNPGNEVGSVTLRIDGPCTGPVITQVSSGRSLVFSSSLLLGAGEWLDIDCDAQSVLANGQSSRATTVLSAQWFGFLPGLNTFAFTAASYNAGSLMTVSATPADK